jgi:hypothetical protein
MIAITMTVKNAPQILIVLESLTAASSNANGHSQW